MNTFSGPCFDFAVFVSSSCHLSFVFHICLLNYRYSWEKGKSEKGKREKDGILWCGKITIKARLRIEARSRSRSVWSDMANPLTAWQNRSPELFPPSLKAFKLKAFLLVNIILNDLFGLDMEHFIAISKLKRLIGHVRRVSLKYQLYNLHTLSSYPYIFGEK